MSQHLKTRVMNGLKQGIGHFIPPSTVSALPTPGVRYFVPALSINALWGAMNTHKDGRKYRKHIILRRVPRCKGLLQLYTYHFPKSWSEGCIANRNIIKLAQRQAHALEHDHSQTGLEWRIRFFKHYFNVFKGGQQPEPGMKRYSRFYQYAYVAIYRQLKAEQQQARDVSFEPITPSPVRTFGVPLHKIWKYDKDSFYMPRKYLSVPDG